MSPNTILYLPILLLLLVDELNFNRRTSFCEVNSRNNVGTWYLRIFLISCVLVSVGTGIALRRMTFRGFLSLFFILLTRGEILETGFDNFIIIQLSLHLEKSK